MFSCYHWFSRCCSIVQSIYRYTIKRYTIHYVIDCMARNVWFAIHKTMCHHGLQKHITSISQAINDVKKIDLKK
jgi:hypothetical protein